MKYVLLSTLTALLIGGPSAQAGEWEEGYAAYEQMTGDRALFAQWQSQALSYFGLFEQMHDFARGVVDTRTVVFYVSAIFFFLFLTLRAVESRRWK